MGNRTITTSVWLAGEKKNNNKRPQLNKHFLSKVEREIE